MSKTHITHFTVLGHTFAVEHYPHLYEMYLTSKPNLERQLGSIADAWHEGSVVGAAQAFESDLAHESGTVSDAEKEELMKKPRGSSMTRIKAAAINAALEYSHNQALENARTDEAGVRLIPLPLPERFKTWFGQPVIATRGLHKSVLIYHKRDERHIRQSIRHAAARFNDAGLDDIDTFLLAGFAEGTIADDGTLYLPDYLDRHLGEPGACVVEERHNPTFDCPYLRLIRTKAEVG